MMGKRKKKEERSTKEKPRVRKIIPMKPRVSEEEIMRRVLAQTSPERKRAVQRLFENTLKTIECSREVLAEEVGVAVQSAAVHP
jgi:hypothetical protein